LRSALLLAFVALLTGCSTAKPLTPREFLDEQTAATITVVAEPMILVGETSSPERRDLERAGDYLEIYGIDVNRMGSHRQYFAVLSWFPLSQGAGTAPTALTLQLGQETLELLPANEEPRTLGISAPLAPSFSKTSVWWYFPTDAATLKKVASSPELRATVATPERHLAYVVFDDGRAELAELTTVLR
jgi:hypothetical protein